MARDAGAAKEGGGTLCNSSDQLLRNVCALFEILARRRDRRLTRADGHVSRLDSMLARSKPALIEGNCRNWDTLAAYREEAGQSRKQLSLVQQSGKAGGIQLFCVMRNEHDLLPRFLDHYRHLGVGRFVIVDNDSSDGSPALLRAQRDVDLYHTRDSYAAANGGTLWLDALMREKARGEWVLRVDADELLVYDQCEKYPLGSLINHLRGIGETRLLAPMVDLYPHPGRVGELFFDATPEQRRRGARGLHIEGGPRHRMARSHGIDASPCLTKYPFARYGARSAFANTHFPYPTAANGDRILGRLLHLKLTGDFKSKVERALRENQHWNEAVEYRGYARWLGAGEGAGLMFEQSTRYTGPGDLIAAALLEPIEWGRRRRLSRMAQTLRRVLVPRA